jgi:hypothetical protein
MWEVLETLYSPDAHERVHIVRRSNGSFGFEEEYFSAHPLEMCWCARRQYPLCVCDAPETALREARARIDWLREQTRNESVEAEDYGR